MASRYEHRVRDIMVRLKSMIGHRGWSLGLIAIVAVISVGCATPIQVAHSELSTNPEIGGDAFNTHVVVQSPTLKSSDIHTKGGFLAVGILNRWDIDVASNLPAAVADAISHSFKTVTVEDHYRRGCDGCGMIIRPRVTDFKLNKITMAARVDVQLRVYDAHEQLIATFEHKGKSPFLSITRAGAIGVTLAAPLVNNLVGKPVIHATVKGALDDAFVDIKDRFEKETRAGGTLARVWRPEKKSFGEHEYTAELLARKLGCDMSTDGLNLVSQRYGKEEYDAYCWNVGVFTISCELGRCGIDAERALAYQEKE